MKRTLLVLFAVAAAAWAQSVETLTYRVNLSSKNEVPAVADPASTGTATVLAHVVRDGSGQIASGSVDFLLTYRLGTASDLTMMHIHRGAAGTNGGVVINSGLAAPIAGATSGTLQLQGQVPPSGAVALQALRDLVADPSGFYLNVHTARNPGGEMRGQLEPAQTLVLFTKLSPLNEVPAISGLTATGAGSIIVRASRTANGSISSAEVVFDANYTGFSEGTTITGFHIHAGPEGTNGPVVINSGLTSVPAVTAGGNLHFEAQIDPANAAQTGALDGLFYSPNNFYMNMHTTAYPAGVMRGQMRSTDRMSFQVTLLPANEVPAITGLDATVAAQLVMHTVRNNDGWVDGGVSIFDANFRFPANTQFTGMHIHDGLASANGSVILNSGLAAANTPPSETGFGNLSKMSTQWTPAAVLAMNQISGQPDSTYYNIHTTVYAGGAARAQTAAARSKPLVTAILSAISDPARTAVAPLGLMTVFGSNLFPATSNSDAFESKAPTQLNSTTVTVGGKQAAILTLGRDASFIPTDYIVAQVPADAATGNQPVVVTTLYGASAATSVPVARMAPAMYFDQAGAIAYRTDMSLIRPSAPAHAGDDIVLLTTGLGQTIPALATGQIAPSGSLAIVPALFTVTIGGKDAPVTGAAAVSGFVGMYGILCRVPDGVTGNLPVVITAGNISSNTATLPVR